MENGIEKRKILEVEGNVSFEGKHCRCYILGNSVNGYLGDIFLHHFAPAQVQHQNERPPDLNTAIYYATEEERIALSKKLEEYENIHVGLVRINFEPQADQGTPLTVEGEVGADLGDLYLESPAVSDFLDKIFLRHFYPENTPCEEEYPEQDSFECGPFRITFELLQHEDTK